MAAEAAATTTTAERTRRRRRIGGKTNPRRHCGRCGGGLSSSAPREPPPILILILLLLLLLLLLPPPPWCAGYSVPPAAVSSPGRRRTAAAAAAAAAAATPGFVPGGGPTTGTTTGTTTGRIGGGGGGGRYFGEGDPKATTRRRGIGGGRGGFGAALDRRRQQRRCLSAAVASSTEPRDDADGGGGGGGGGADGAVPGSGRCRGDMGGSSASTSSSAAATLRGRIAAVADRIRRLGEGDGNEGGGGGGGGVFRQDAVNRWLVRRGAEFRGKSSSPSSSAASEAAGDDGGSNEDDGATLASAPEKVPGCVADVRLGVVLETIGKDTRGGGGGVVNGPCGDGKLDGVDSSLPYRQYRVASLAGSTSDAMLSRGLLAVFSDAVVAATASEIMDLEPHLLADMLGLRPYLSKGRNDGLASMLRTLQNRIRFMLLKQEGEEEEEEEEGYNEDGSEASVAETGVATTATTAKKAEADEAAAAGKKVALLLSGGVDSSVALRLLLDEGYDVTAYYLRIWLEDELAHLGVCPWEDDYEYCRQVCQQAGVQLNTVSLQSEYRDRVISYTVEEAGRGRTPNPDIMCNSRIKFGCFFDAIDEGAASKYDYVASGHYARVERDGDGVDGDSGAVHLYRAPDPVKDQSYFLCALTQDQLRRAMFPLGRLLKSEVRELANRYELPNRDRPDSQGLCFLGKVKFEEFLRAYLGEEPGDVVDAATGDVIGRHRGLWYHTVGQRKGIGKALHPTATSRGPWYVVGKDPAANLVLCSNEYDRSIFEAARSQIAVESVRWIAGSPPPGGRRLRLAMKIRHGPKIVEGWLTLRDGDEDGGDNGMEGDVELDEKDGGLAPGQYVAFYSIDGSAECLGGGVISERQWTKFLLDEDRSRNAQEDTPTAATAP